MLKKRDPNTFDFLSKYQINFPIHPNLARMLRIDADKSTRYMLDRYSRQVTSQSNLVKTCV